MQQTFLELILDPKEVEEKKPFTKAIAKFKVQTFQKKDRPIKEQLFPQISEALGHERVQFTLVRLLPRFGITANFSGGDPGAKRSKKSLLQ